MNLLLDTQCFIWFIGGNPSLSDTARNLIEDVANTRHLSIASLWEIAIKMSIGKLSLGLPFDVLIPQQIHQNLIDTLDITIEHVSVISTLPFHHKDPFDRLLVAQAIVEQIPIVSIDSAFDAYGITRLW